MKILYIIPGFGETTKSVGYQNIINYAEEKGFVVISFDPQWKRSTIKNWLEAFNKLVGKNIEDAVVIGFSFGAYIAALSAKNHRFSKIIFCSLSPYFKDDIQKLPALAHRMLGKKRIQHFSENSFPDNISTPALFIVGDKDMRFVIDRVKKSYKKWMGPKKLEIIKGAEHDINNDSYLEIIKANI